MRNLPCLSLLLSCLLFASPASADAPIPVPGLEAKAEVLRDFDGIPHIIAETEHDLVMMQGWAHARDRLFQMDVLRRRASGTLAELFGPSVLADDVELRTIGLRRAAARSLSVLSAEALAALEAYAEGVNVFVATHPLPPEYVPLELTTFEPWTVLDSLAVAKLFAFGLSFDLDDISRTETLVTYQIVGGLAGFDGAALFFEDTHRSAPFVQVATVPEASMTPLVLAAPTVESLQELKAQPAEHAKLRSEVVGMASAYLKRLQGLPHVRAAMRLGEDMRGSNEWAISGALTVTGLPLLANDPHLDLEMPAIFHQIHLQADTAGFDVIGAGFPGAPYVVIGHNRKITWGATFNPLDVTDVFQEQIVPDAASPSGLSIVHEGVAEWIIPIPQIFQFNQISDGIPDNLSVASPGGGVPAAVLIVPRRNNGPIVVLDLVAGTALSIQYTGFSGTRELDAFRFWNLAEDLDGFVAGLQDFDVGSQNWAYADTRGNIAYFTSAEIPLREDLQAGIVNGLPPFFIRYGTGGNEWLPLSSPPPGQAVPYEVLPFDEMPQIVNPPRGFVFNANNDPSGITLDNDPLNQLRSGGGIFYLSPGYDIGLRAGRIKQLLEERLADGGLVSAEDMMDIQADVVLLDAQVFTPLILEAHASAIAPGAHPALAGLAADPRVGEAVARLSAWDHSTPTGISEGYDSSDFDGQLTPPDDEEVANSVAATIYSVWRGQMIGNTIDTVLDFFSLPRPNSRRSVSALRHLFDTFAENQGIGASGLNFFNVPGIPDPGTRRDILVLKSLSDALDLLAGSAFAAAFGGSTDQDEYRWGLLHRIVFDHPLGAPFSIPPAGGAFPPPLAGLPGIPVDGGFVTVDAARHSVRANDSDDFTFDAGPTRRFVAEVRSRPPLVEAETSLPGGESGILGSPFYTDLLPRWLTNDTHPLRLRAGDFASSAVEKLEFEPAPGS